MLLDTLRAAQIGLAATPPLAALQIFILVTRSDSHALNPGFPHGEIGLLLVQPVNERLRLLGGTAKVALDLLEYDSQLERAFITICGCALLLRAHFTALPLAPQDTQQHSLSPGTRQGLWTRLVMQHSLLRADSRAPVLI